MRPALVACDLDGTLVGARGLAAPGVESAVFALRAAGVHVVVCTGRTVKATRAAAARLGIRSGPAIAYHGGVVIDLGDGSWLLRCDLPVEAGPAVVRAATQAGAFATAYVEDECWEEAGAALRRGGAPPPPTRLVDDLAAAVSGLSVTRVVLEAPDPSAEAGLIGALAELTVRRPDLGVSPAPGGRLEVHHVDADKGLALAALCRRLGVPQEVVVACGDAQNDASMLRWAALGVALAQGDEACRTAADVVVPRSQLAWFLEGLLHGDRALG